jgi:surfactin synthase thioesterase subunit
MTDLSASACTPFPAGTPARLRLICFPSAGAGASLFVGWKRHLPAEIQLCPIQPPGRETRMRDRPHRRMEPLVREFADALQPYLDRPYAFFGHSLGSYTAFELARELRQRGQPAPAHFFAAAMRAPHVPDPKPPLFELAEPDFLAALAQRYDALPAELLATREFREVFLPPLRADVELLDTYVHAPGEPLDCPITVYGGTRDAEMTPESLAAWEGYTRGRFDLRSFEGDHFFVRSEAAAVARAVAAALGF